MLLQGTICRAEQVAGSAPLPIPCTRTPRNPEFMLWLSQAPHIGTPPRGLGAKLSDPQCDLSST